MDHHPLEGLRNHEVIVEQIWGDGTRAFHHGRVEEVVGTLVHLVDTDTNYDPSPAWARAIAEQPPIDHRTEAVPDRRTPMAEFSDFWVNLGSIAVAGFVDVTATRPDLQRKVRCGPRAST